MSSTNWTELYSKQRNTECLPSIRKKHFGWILTGYKRNYFIGESSRSTKPEFRKFTQKPAILDNIQDPKTGISRSSAQSRPKIPSAIPSGVLRFITSSTISQRSC
ncbi:unnamed protein product [Rhizophagus irregularis]|nr:unnamed protein product [Rhizophagus irregularis]CAB5206270.1 unnamed protein product [Rhizophagus irregularis]CAB5368416.1 unnamed protein product [Rhizophagus irregularis]